MGGKYMFPGSASFDACVDIFRCLRVSVQERTERERAAAEEEAARQQQAVAELERKLGGGRRKERRGRRQQTAEPEPSSVGRWLLVAAGVAVLAVTAGLLLYQ